MKLRIVGCGLQIGVRHLLVPAVLLAGWLCGIGTVAAAQTEMIDRVLAVVAGDLITLSDVNACRELGLLAGVQPASPTSEVLPRLIDRALMLAEVERYAPPEPAAASVDRQVQLAKSRFATTQAFEAVLARVGYDERHLRETVRQDLRLAAYLDQRFTVPPPSQDDLGRYYREHPDRFAEGGQLAPFDEARPRVLEALVGERRQRLVSDWVAGLRKRAEISDMSDPRQ